ncbi:maternal effect embryo arrest 59 [Zea mays]|nr:maternal effect embryo arrest 59 [Zea mays]
MQRSDMLLAGETLLPTSGSRQLTRCTRRQTSQAEATAEGLYISSHENSDGCFPPLPLE